MGSGKKVEEAGWGWGGGHGIGIQNKKRFFKKYILERVILCMKWYINKRKSLVWGCLWEFFFYFPRNQILYHEITKF